MKTCKKCLKEKPLEDFYKNKYSPDKRQAWCKSCHRTRWADYSADSDVKRRRYDKQAQRRFGLRLGERVYLERAQDNKCLGCGLKKKLVVDHDHASGHVRGLLCANCNSALGLIEDNPVTLLNLWAYLKGKL